MKIEQIIEQAAALRDEVKSLLAETETAAPHLCNAAGALHAAVTNLGGHLTAIADQAEAKAGADKLG